ncbi:MAG: patatin-like phospholipase family protein [Clostridium celatum]|nr:patatin-like phospholipase family protein [Clostridium celatum]MCE9656853.1 patatin-like phospholipase family protein [Clostridium celatum]MDU6295914.1 patatin-like phospholipase family protein [Clostridium celatum]MDY3359093.1 patatin-like phospholipase family protein [Clostridium celatum]
MIDIEDLFDLNIGLVLAGGGAKGAYEAGVFKALWELDIIRRISVVSGVSIGTINGLMLSMNDGSIMDKSWSNIRYSRFINNENTVRDLKIKEFIKKTANGENQLSLLQSFKRNDIGLLSQSGIKSFIEDYVDFQIIRDSKKLLYACAYNIDLEEPEYFKLNDYDDEDILNICIASCAVPYLFKPIKIGKYRYADGGVNNPKYINQNADNVPIKPLKTHNCDIIIVVHLAFNQPINREGFENTHIIEIYPSMQLELINGIGTVNIRQNVLSQHIELGYRDALTILAPMIIDMLKGKPLEKLIKKHEEYNKELLNKNRHSLI